jgi:hypothetical protein
LSSSSRRTDASSSPCERSASDLSASSSSSVAIRAICAADQSSDEAMATAHLWLTHSG